MNRTIQAVLFDLGDTLMFSPAPWPPVFERAGRNLSQFLFDNGMKIDPKNFHVDFLQQLDNYYSDRERNLVETTTLTALHQLLSEKGNSDLPEYFLRLALKKFYLVTQQYWFLEEDAIELLKSLQTAGYHLGLVSNAGDDQDVHQQVDSFGIRPYFDFILTSAACGYRKPHPQIFRTALAQWGYMPDEIAMVGDRLDADIGGARPLGIFTIWVKKRAKINLASSVIPDAIVENLSEIPPLLFNLANNG